MSGTTPTLSREEKQELLRRVNERLQEFKLEEYNPYPKQREFHALGRVCKERLLRAGNQQGKTHAGGMELAFHLTGKYPPWWEGRRFNRPIEAWACCDTGETTRDNPQRSLIGGVGQWGTGAVPRDLLGEVHRARGVADLIDTIEIKHVSGGVSRLAFKFYAQGREAWQGPGKDVIWCDEEPPLDVYGEALARLVATGGMIYTTFTPLRGMSTVVARLLGQNDGKTVADINMGIEDALHIPASERAAIIAAFPEHEREARIYGTPMLGSGRVFPISEAEICVAAFAVPRHWPVIGAMDFGWDHPFAAVKLAWDRDADTVYITNTYRAQKQTPVVHAAALRSFGKHVPFAWPHDGLVHDKGSGTTLAAQYKREGLRMLGNHATHADGGIGLEAGIMEMLDRMKTGRFKVFENLGDWREEFRNYHRLNGQVVKERDDLISATRIGIMMLRAARTPDAVASSPTMCDSDYNPLDGIPGSSGARARGRFGMPIDSGMVYPSDRARTVEDNSYDPLAPLGSHDRRH